MKLDSIYVVVRDMPAAREFYERIFDRPPLLTDERFSGFDLEGALFGLFSAEHFGEAVDTEPLTWGNNCVPTIRVADLDQLYDRLQALDPPELTPVQIVRDYRLFQLRDADGNRVEFYESGA